MLRATVKLENFVTSSVISNETISLNPDQLTGADGFYTKTFEFETDTHLDIIISARASAALNTSTEFFVKEIMLERGVGASEYSMVTYGNFGPSIESDVINDYWKPDSSAESITIVDSNTSFEKAIKISAGGPGNKRYAYQRTGSCKASGLC